MRETADQDVHDVRPGLAPLELRIGPAQGLSELIGVVRGPRNEVLEGAEVTLWQEPDKLWRSVPASAADGSFTIDAVPEGTCYVTARAAGFPSTRVPAQTLASGTELDLGTLRLQEPARIEGTLTGASDALLEALTLELYDGNELLDEEVPRSGRRFRSQPLAAGTYQLIARGDGLRSRRIEFRVHAGEDVERSVEIHTALQREVVLELPEGSGQPRRVFCRATNAAGEIVWMRTLRLAEDGPRFVMSAPLGTYRLTAVANNGLFGVTRISMEAEPQEALALELLREE